MIYSVHNSTAGGFDYFLSADDTPINDDLPTPKFTRQTKVGVAASAAARPLPPDALQVGHGQLPVGCICSGNRGLWRGNKKSLPSGLGASDEVEDVSWESVGLLSMSAAAATAALMAKRETEGFAFSRTDWALTSALCLLLLVRKKFF